MAQSPQDAQYEIRPAAFFDLDGTIRRSKTGEFIDGPEDVELFPDVEEKLHGLESHVLFGVTNQGGVAFGHKTVQDVRNEIQATKELFDDNPFKGFFASPYHPDGHVEPYNQRSLLRKPGVGMLAWAEIEANREYISIDWDGSFMVGDRPEDKECAENASIDFHWATNFFDR